MTAPDETRWLDDVERDAWMYLLGIMTRLPGVLDDQLRQDCGIGHFDYLVLAVVSMAPGPSERMSTVAEIARVKLPHLSRVVTRLEKRGLVDRFPDEENRRHSLLALTDEGRALLDAAAPGHVAAVRRHVFDLLTPTQVRQLRSIGAVLVSGLGRDHLPADVTSPDELANAPACDPA